MGSHGHSDRRKFLTESAALAGLAGLTLQTADAAQTSQPGARLKDNLAYGQPSQFDNTVRRATGTGTPITDTALTTPLQDLDGIITPSGLHFLMDHVNGIPDINPQQHRLLMHGLVDRPLTFQQVAGPTLSTSRLSPTDTRRAVNRLVKRATLLHTDIALLVPATADGPAESVPVPRPRLPTRSSVQLEDGRQIGASYYGTHWDMARLLLDQVTPDPGADNTVRQWYRNIAALFSSKRMHAESIVHVERGRQLFPADAEILAANGRLHETFAAPGIQQFLEGRAGADGDASRSLMGSARSNLRQAEAFFSKAVELNGRFAAARLHLGRVLGLQGRHADAASQLRQAADTADDSLTRTTRGSSWALRNRRSPAPTAPTNLRQGGGTSSTRPVATTGPRSAGATPRRSAGAFAALSACWRFRRSIAPAKTPWSSFLREATRRRRLCCPNCGRCCF